jgi:hypothetical protein
MSTSAVASSTTTVVTAASVPLPPPPLAPSSSVKSSTKSLGKRGHVSDDDEKHNQNQNQNQNKKRKTSTVISPEEKAKRDAKRAATRDAKLKQRESERLEFERIRKENAALKEQMKAEMEKKSKAERSVLDMIHEQMEVLKCKLCSDYTATPMQLCSNPEHTCCVKCAKMLSSSNAFYILDSQTAESLRVRFHESKNYSHKCPFGCVRTTSTILVSASQYLSGVAFIKPFLDSQYMQWKSLVKRYSDMHSTIGMVDIANNHNKIVFADELDNPGCHCIPNVKPEQFNERIRHSFICRHRVFHSCPIGNNPHSSTELRPSPCIAEFTWNHTFESSENAAASSSLSSAKTLFQRYEEAVRYHAKTNCVNRIGYCDDSCSEAGIPCNELSNGDHQRYHNAYRAFCRIVGGYGDLFNQEIQGALGVDTSSIVSRTLVEKHCKSVLDQLRAISDKIVNHITDPHEWTNPVKSLIERKESTLLKSFTLALAPPPPPSATSASSSLAASVSASRPPPRAESPTLDDFDPPSSRSRSRSVSPFRPPAVPPSSAVVSSTPPPLSSSSSSSSSSSFSSVVHH